MGILTDQLELRKNMKTQSIFNKYRSIWNDDVFCCFGNIKTLDQTLVKLEQLRI